MLSTLQHYGTAAVCMQRMHIKTLVCTSSISMRPLTSMEGCISVTLRRLGGVSTSLGALCMCVLVHPQDWHFLHARYLGCDPITRPMLVSDSATEFVEGQCFPKGVPARVVMSEVSNE